MNIRSAAAICVAAAFSLSVSGCGAPSNDKNIVSQAQELELAFEQAAATSDVPVTLLKAVGFTASRWHHAPDGHLLDAHGIMQLSTERVQAAAALTGLAEETIRGEAPASILAAAALLAELAREMGLDEERGMLGSWWETLLAWSESSDHSVAESYAAGVLQTMAKGAKRTFSDGSTLILEPSNLTLPNDLFVLRQGQGTTDYPNAIWAAAHSANYMSGRTESVDRIVITTAGGSATSAINTFQDPSSERSVHYLVHWSGAVTQLVREVDTARHSACYNNRSVGIMLEGFITLEDNYTDEMYESLSALVRWITTERSLPRTPEVIIGHSAVDCEDGIRRQAPGQHFDWDLFLATVNGSSIKGEVFFGTHFWTDIQREDNRISGALVWLDTGQMTLSSGSRGAFELVVPPGNYHITAEADGYVPATQQCDVLPDQITWCSVMVTVADNPIPEPNPDQGLITGVVVWGERDENPFDIITNHRDTRFVAGATVTITPGPVTVTTNEEGFFFAPVDPGTYLVVAEADGYEAREAPLGLATVAAGDTVFRSVMVLVPLPPAPEVTITRPLPHEVFDVEEITVAGRVTHDRIISTVTVNATPVSFRSGLFSTPFTLSRGVNTIMVAATDVDGVTGYASVTVVYRTDEPGEAGVDGFVWDGHLGMAAPIAGATVRVGNQTATTQHDGWFSLDIAAGTYALRMSAPGYDEYSQAVTVLEGTRTDVLLPLYPEGEGRGPKVTITAPADGATVQQPNVVVEGTTAPPDPGISVAVNGVPVSYSSGAFSGQIQLIRGANAIVVEAVDSLGDLGTSAITVYYDDPTAPRGGVDGFVFDSSAGQTSPVAGAVVTIGGSQVTTATDGTFSIELSAGTYTVTVSRDGFEGHTATVEVLANERTSIEIGLVPTGDPGEDRPIIEITFPADGEVLTAPRVMVAGRLNHPDVTQVLVNGVEASIGSERGFTLEVVLEPGENRIEARALNLEGVELGSTVVTVQYTGTGTAGCSCASNSNQGSNGAALLGLLTLCILLRPSTRRFQRL